MGRTYKRPIPLEACVVVIGNDQDLVRQAAGDTQHEIHLQFENPKGAWFGVIVKNPSPNAAAFAAAIRSDFKLEAAATVSLREAKIKMCLMQGISIPSTLTDEPPKGGTQI